MKDKVLAIYEINHYAGETSYRLRRVITANEIENLSDFSEKYPPSTFITRIVEIESIAKETADGEKAERLNSTRF